MLSCSSKHLSYSANWLDSESVATTALLIVKSTRSKFGISSSFSGGIVRGGGTGVGGGGGDDDDDGDGDDDEDDDDEDDPVFHTRTLRMLCGAPTCATSGASLRRAVQRACLRKARASPRRVSIVPRLKRAAQQLRQVSSAPTTPPSRAFPRRVLLAVY